MFNIVFQCYGKKMSMHQCIYCIYSIIKHTPNLKNIRIVLYTDQKDFLLRYFKNYDFISYEPLTPEIMKLWKGKIDFYHRLKIEMLKDASLKYDGHIIYMDGDMYITKDFNLVCSRILENQSVMHLSENTLGQTKNTLAKKIWKFLCTNKIYVRGVLVSVKPETTIWNAGVIGLHRKNVDLWDYIIEYTDELYSRYPKHIMEQYAVSYFVQNRTNVVASDDVIEHYWNQKDTDMDDSFFYCLEDFFNANYPEDKDFLEKVYNLKLPKRHYGSPRYTLAQKIKKKKDRMKQRYQSFLNKFNASK